MSANVENKMLIVGGNIPATFVEIIPKIYALDNCELILDKLISKNLIGSRLWVFYTDFLNKDFDIKYFNEYSSSQMLKLNGRSRLGKYNIGDTVNVFNYLDEVER
tara:strand:- start:1046 stop:1360 length:315 start_codon:yes stop_codon:yes gene_type:complete